MKKLRGCDSSECSFSIFFKISTKMKAEFENNVVILRNHYSNDYLIKKSIMKSLQTNTINVNIYKLGGGKIFLSFVV